jgi:hypothetical protein
MSTKDLDPRVRIQVKGKNVDEKDIIGVNVVDKLEENDEFDFAVYNRDRKYKGAFEKAQDIIISFGYGDNLKKLITGYTDEIRYAGSTQGEIVSVKGTSLKISGAVQTKESKTWENTTLKNMLEDISKKIGLKAEDLTKILTLHSLKIEQTQQINDSPLHFFQRIAKMYGLEVQVKDGKLIVRDPVDKTTPPVTTFSWGPGDISVISYEACEQCKDVYKETQGTDYDPVNKKTITEKIEGETPVTDKVESILKKYIPSKDPKDLKEKTKATTKTLNRKEKTMDITVPGQNYYRAGAAYKVKNIEHDGQYYIREVTHSYSKSQGYICNINGTNKK